MSKKYLTEHIYYDDVADTLLMDNTVLPLSGRGKELFLYLLNKEGTVATHEELKEKIWKSSSTDNNTVSKTIGRLREKLGDKDEKILKKIPKEGYQLIILREEKDPAEPDYQLLPHRLTDFTGILLTDQQVIYRKIEQNTIIKALKKEGNQAILLHGLGGVGKTSLARLVFSSLIDEYNCVGWINYQGDLKSSLLSSLAIDTDISDNNSQQKWIYLSRLLRNNKQKKLFVIDNTDPLTENDQNPQTDRTLQDITSWRNTDIILTSRLSDILLYTPYPVNSLKEAHCIRLFYHYNHEAAAEQTQNESAVKRLVKLAHYNTFVIELLAKSSYYEESLDEFCNKLESAGFSSSDAQVSTLHDNIRGTLSQQLENLFRMKDRNPVERLILWDFQALPENQGVSQTILRNWLGYTIPEIDPLVKEGWISYKNKTFSIHPLVRQAFQTSESQTHEYWNQKQQLLKKKSRQSLIHLLKNREFFSKDDSYKTRNEKLIFADALTHTCIQMDVEDMLYIADYARENHFRTIAFRFYESAYERVKDEIEQLLNETASSDSCHKKYDLHTIDLYWRCTYYYGYLLSYTQKYLPQAEELLSKSLQILKQTNTFAQNFNMSRSYSHLGYVRSFDPMKIFLALEDFRNAISLVSRGLGTIYQQSPQTRHYYAWCIDDYGSFCAINYDTLRSQTRPDEFSDMIKLAENYLREALFIREEAAQFSNNPFSKEVAWTCVNLARLLGKININLFEAEIYIKQALKIYEYLCEKTPLLHNGDTARAYTVYAQILENKPERYGDAMKFYQKALALNMELEKYTPDTYTIEIQNIKSAIDNLLCRNVI